MTELPSWMFASIVSLTVLMVPAPAPATAPVRPAPVERAPASEPPIASDQIVAVELAERVTSPAAVTTELSM